MGTIMIFFLNISCSWLSDVAFDKLKVSCVPLLISTITLFGYSPIHNSLTYYSMHGMQKNT